MTTTNVYQGLSGDNKSTSRVLQAPGGGSSNIFGHYEEESQRERGQQHQRGSEAVMQSAAMAAQRNGDASHNYQDNKDSFAANRLRNQGDGAPFATNNSMVSAPVAEKASMQAPVMDGNYQTPRQQQAANRMRNQGTAAPFATGDFGQAPEPTHGAVQSRGGPGADYLTPQQRQANNPNKAANSFSNLFGDVNDDDAHGKPKGKGTFNPITGEDHVASNDGRTASTKVHAPPGGQSSIQF